jgi:uncharacterized protein (TIGR02058 family)
VRKGGHGIRVRRGAKAAVRTNMPGGAHAPLKRIYVGHGLRDGALRTLRGDKAMAKKRMVLEIGMGTDIRGADPTKAACRALRDALWHNSLSIGAALGQSADAMIVDVLIGVPRPEMVDKAQVLAVLPHGTGTVTVVEGGLEIANDAGTDSTLIANACAVVSLDIA